MSKKSYTLLEEFEQMISEDPFIAFLRKKITDLEKVNLKLTEKIQKLEKPKQNDVDIIRELIKIDVNNFDCDVCKAHGITNCMRDKEYCVGYNNWLEKHKDDKWIVHRTLRKLNKEVYICGPFSVGVSYRTKSFFTTDNKNSAAICNLQNAIKIRDELNKDRVGKRYLWVISKYKKGG